MPRKLAVVLLLFFLFLPRSGICQTFIAQQPRGPLTLRDMRPFNLLFLSFSPEAPDTLAPRDNTFGLQLDIANNHLYTLTTEAGRYVEDNEYQRLLFSWRRGTGKNAELSLFVPVLWRNGGVIDSLINGWHRLFGIGRNVDDRVGRTERPEYRSVLVFTDSQGKSRYAFQNGFGLGDVSFTLKRALLPASHRSGLALRLGAKLPTGNPNLLLGSGGFDVGASLDGRYTFGRNVTAYINLSGVIQGGARLPGAQRGTFGGVVSLEYHANSRDSYYIQFDGNSAAVRTGLGFPDSAQVSATFGYKRALDRALLLSLAFSENGDINNYRATGFGNVGPDFTFHVGIVWHP